jgi:hypothetical protein
VHVAALTVELHLPQAHSLKEKRAVVTPILEGCRRRFSVAAAEVGNQDLWQRSTLGMSAVSSSPTRVGELLDSVERFVWSFPDVEVTASRRDWLETS